MKPSDYAVDLVMSVILIVGLYQFYFWCQRNYVTRPRELKVPLDDMIPYQPGWVWIYSCLYYPVIVYINFAMQSPRQFLYVAMSFIILLVLQMLFFLLFPVTTPEHWRTCNQRRTRSERFLAFVQSFDTRANCFPSMHASVATLTALHLLPQVGPWVWSFPVLVGVSCLFTKQHYLIDLPAGAALGALAFWIYRLVF
jgi:membrane-associated phospholipid phosphatase